MIILHLCIFLIDTELLSSVVNEQECERKFALMPVRRKFLYIKRVWLFFFIAIVFVIFHFVARLEEIID